jgi:outer membrane receptor protein involved in Fe transport
MVYAFYSRGYKGGGANPPSPGFATLADNTAQMLAEGFSQDTIDSFASQGLLPVLQLNGAEYSRVFKPEFVNAFELGSKNTLLNGALVFNTGAFFYDYKDYQVSQIRDRTAVNENFDARTWGFEFETVFSPSRNFQVVANLGYLDTRIAEGMKSIDIMDRTQGNPDWVVAKPWAQLPSNCIVPTVVAEAWLLKEDRAYVQLCGGVGGILGLFANQDPLVDPNTGLKYDVNHYPEANGGAGLWADLGGNKLPNAPHWTMNIGAQYGHDILDGSWRMTVRGDAYWQSQSWARVYNDNPYDKLHGWYNVNLSVWFERPDDDLKIELYAKNILDKTPITDAFLNSDDTALTTNVFVLDPRLIGLSIKKGF